MKHFYLKIQGDMPGTQVGPCYASSGEGSPAYLPWVKQSAEHGSYPRSPDQALVFHRRPDKGRLRSVTEKPYQVAGEASRQKAKTLDHRFNMSGVNGERVSIWRVGMFDEDRNCRITPLTNPTYRLGQRLDRHGKLQPDAL